MTTPVLDTDECSQVSLSCPVEGTIYGYYPSIAANSFFTAFFGLCFLIQLVLGIRYKTWTYLIALALGCLGEAIGYVGRILLYNNPYDSVGFQIQICCLIISPAFVSAGMYLTLKHAVIVFGESWSRFKPDLYTYVFIAGDLVSLILQGAGGGIAATSDPGELQDIGTDLMIAGVIFQVFILSIFGYLCTEYAVKTYRYRNQIRSEASALLKKTSFRYFVLAVFIAYLSIFARCVYRIPELTGGWRNEIMRNEPEFIILEGVMITISVLVLTVFHPGFCFPALGNTIGKKQGNEGGKGTGELLVV